MHNGYLEDIELTNNMIIISVKIKRNPFHFALKYTKADPFFVVVLTTLDTRILLTKSDSKLH